ncbi:prepilin-type N-terminal cleavage/methylation domain-containing protein [Desulforamulus putei DSM 12395]|uniref:Prepilin-type N-terminal cleavage/methylation domain-containing protein n=1 Tax=Desulforamulus putei DSM 12395 TaxID=1121429 RepID=A0A1M4UVG7_9FIRM|nr:prepilin-type N-terminal cleavage/methylation domain-containing protein [Desulforamulus putei]SHE60637.1 prepilin-type N-terminal cleavage/methylation domain-containing protein [Desulforamulus putei DSM 12395]
MGNPVYGKNEKVTPGKAFAQQGLTLIEVLVSMVLFIFLVNTAYAFLFSGVISYVKYSDENDVRSQLRIGMNRMERELKEARWLTTNTGPSVLKFRLPKHMTDTNKGIPLTFSRDKIVSYYVKDGELLRRIYDIPSSGFDGQSPNRGDPASRPNEGVNSIARNIESLELTYLPEDAADNSYKTTVLITLTGKGRSAKPIVLTSTVRLRAQKGW